MLKAMNQKMYAEKLSVSTISNYEFCVFCCSQRKAANNQAII
jgi:hypothetical protein